MSDSEQDRIKTYEAFWPFYVMEHSRRGTQWAHAVGTFGAVGLVFYAVATAKWHLLPLALVCGYGPAWVSHFFYQRNRPATFKYPLWSFISDFRMVAYLLLGKMGQEVEKASKR